MSIRALRPGGAVTLPSPKPVSVELGAQHHRGLTIRHADTEAIRSGAQQVITHGSRKHVGGRTTTASVDRRGVRKYRWPNRAFRHLRRRRRRCEHAGAVSGHGGSRNLPPGASCLSKRVLAASIAFKGNVSWIACRKRSLRRCRAR
jgi:hypothetical protein